MKTEAIWMTDRRPDLPTIVLASALGTGPESVYGPLVPQLGARSNIIGLVMPGHLENESPEYEFSLDDIAKEVEQHLIELHVAEYIFAGLSIGSAVGVTLAARNAPSPQIQGLILLGALPQYADPTAWMDRARRVRLDGMSWLSEFLLPRWFTAKLRDERPDWVEAVLADVAACHVGGYVASCLALARYNAERMLPSISVPTSFVIGLQDQVAPAEQSLRMAAAIPGITNSEVITPAAHILPLESPARIARAILDMLPESHE